jgi:hypothetical protein
MLQTIPHTAQITVTERKTLLPGIDTYIILARATTITFRAFRDIVNQSSAAQLLSCTAICEQIRIMLRTGNVLDKEACHYFASNIWLSSND